MSSKSNAFDLFEYIEDSPTMYHVVKTAGELIDAIVLRESDAEWDVCPGQTYMVTRNDSSAVFVHVPKISKTSVERPRFDIAVAHTDSPALKLKSNPIISKNGYVMLNVEEYGFAVRKSWFDRPLSVAGRAVANIDGNIVTFLVDLGNTFKCFIPSLAPHMGSKETDETSVQTDLLPVIGCKRDLADLGYDEKRLNCILDYAIEEWLRSNRIGRKPSCDIVDYDLYCYDTSAVTYSDAANRVVMSPRIDDQGCVWGLVDGFARFLNEGDACFSDDNGCFAVLALLDDEENGSAVYNGADSSFLRDVLTRIWRATEDYHGGADFDAAIARSFMVSADNGHAIHPAHPEKACPTNAPVMGDGIVLKRSATKKYMTDARSGAAFIALCNEHGVSYQTYQNNSDVRGGSTLGNIQATHLSIPGVDIGLPQLAMHSIMECAHVDDLQALSDFAKAYFSGARDENATTSEIVAY